MTRDDDDLTPAQKGKLPGPRTLKRRKRAEAGRGRLLRLRSWLTVLIGAVAIAIALYVVLKA